MELGYKHNINHKKRERAAAQLGSANCETCDTFYDTLRTEASDKEIQIKKFR